jgi:hypothetical protein
VLACYLVSVFEVKVHAEAANKKTNAKAAEDIFCLYGIPFLLCEKCFKRRYFIDRHYLKSTSVLLTKAIFFPSGDHAGVLIVP